MTLFFRILTVANTFLILAGMYVYFGLGLGTERLLEYIEDNDKNVLKSLNHLRHEVKKLNQDVEKMNKQQ